MNDKFDGLAKNMAQSITRRQALQRLGIGLGSMVLATLGFTNRAEALSKRCGNPCDCGAAYLGCCPDDKHCLRVCGPQC